MEHELCFTEVRATYSPKGILAGPRRIAFDIEMPVGVYRDGDGVPVKFEVVIDQGPNRQIGLKTAEPMLWGCLLTPLYDIERLLAIFDGSFVPIENIDFTRPGDLTGSGDVDCAIAREHTLKQRLGYFASSSWSLSSKKLIDFWEVLTPELLERWHELLDELDIANQVYLYSLSDNGMPVDLRLAFLAELAETMVEIMKAERGWFPSLKPGERGTTLKDCLKAMIDTYGQAIFRREIKDDYDGLLSLLSDSRVRIMHIKRNRFKDACVDGAACGFYLMKLSVLYRVMILDLLDIPEGVYAQRLSAATSALDEWMGRPSKV